jgi:hypothetical protein
MLEPKVQLTDEEIHYGLKQALETDGKIYLKYKKEFNVKCF